MQRDLFAPALPEGMLYRPDFLSAEEEQDLAKRWQRVRWLMWRKTLKPRIGRKSRATYWVPASSLRPPTSPG